MVASLRIVVNDFTYIILLTKYHTFLLLMHYSNMTVIQRSSARFAWLDVYDMRMNQQ